MEERISFGKKVGFIVVSVQQLILFKILRQLERANGGDAYLCEKFLAHAYGRRGKVKHLMAKVLDALLAGSLY